MKRFTSHVCRRGSTPTSYTTTHCINQNSLYIENNTNLQLNSLLCHYGRRLKPNHKKQATNHATFGKNGQFTSQVPFSEGNHFSLGQPMTKHHSIFQYQNGSGRVFTPTKAPDNSTAIVLRNEILRSRDLFTIFGGVWSGNTDPKQIDRKSRANIYKALFTAWDNRTEITLSILNGRMNLIGSLFPIFAADQVVATPGASYSCIDPIFGIIPEGGQTYFLSHLNTIKPGLGTFLALTGYELNASDLIALGIASHYHNSSGFGIHLTNRIQEYYSQPCKTVFNQVLEEILNNPETQKHELSLSKEELEIVEVFQNFNTYQDIFNSGLPASMMKRIDRIKPDVVNATIRAINFASELTLDEAMNMEYRVVMNMIQRPKKQGEGYFLESDKIQDLYLPGSIYADLYKFSVAPVLNKTKKTLAKRRGKYEIIVKEQKRLAAIKRRERYEARMSGILTPEEDDDDIEEEKQKE